MGKVTDWIKIFELLEDFDYEAKLVIENAEGMAFIAEETGRGYIYPLDKRAAEESEAWERSIEAFAREKKYAGLKEREEAYEAEIFKEGETREKAEGAVKFYKETEETAERFEAEEQGENISRISESTPEYGEPIDERLKERIMQMYEAEKESAQNVFEEGLFKKTEKGKAEKIIQWGQEKEKDRGRDIKIEMHNVNNVQSEMDIDTVTDMLTERLCELMQKSAEGFYM